MTFLPSSSKLELASHCGYAWSTHRPGWPKQVYYGAAGFGKAQHKIGELTILGQPVDVEAILAENGVVAKADVERARRTAVHTINRFTTFRQRRVEWHVERSVAYSPTTGSARWLAPAKHERDYSDRRDGELTGTMDLACVDAGVVEIFDLKTGINARQSNVADSYQLRFYAVALSRIYGVARARITYVHADEDGIDEDVEELDELQLGAFAAELERMVASLPGSTPNPGPWCTSSYCQVVSVCPATMAALAQVDAASAVPGAQPMTVHIRDAAHAASVRVRLKMVQSHSMAIETALKDWVRANGPVQLGDGVTYGVRSEDRETVDIATPGAYAVLAKHLGGRADTACTLDTSKAAIVTAAGSKKAAEPILEDLRRIGAVRVSHYEKLAEWKERKK